MAKDKVSKSQGGHVSLTHRDLLIDDIIPWDSFVITSGKRDGNNGHTQGRGGDDELESGDGCKIL